MYVLTLNVNGVVTQADFFEEAIELTADQVSVDWADYLQATTLAPLTYIEGVLSAIPQPSLYHSWVNFEWIIDDSKLNTAQALAWQSIKTLRDYRLNSGFKVGNYWYHSDDPSRIKYLGLMIMGAGIPAGLQWKTMTGAFITMTQSLAYQIFIGIAGWDSATFIKAEQHKAAMIASSDPATYDYSTGWPAVFGE